jgi:hypothetical protein
MDPHAIQLAVGSSPARNRPEDQSKIAALLNSIGPGDGGPQPRVDLSSGPKRAIESLTAAIRNFQTFHQSKLKFKPDGRVDPNGATWRLLKDIAGKQHGALGVDIPEAFPGVDISWFNEIFIKWIKDNTNFLWIGYYLPYAKYSEDGVQKAGWAGKFEALKKMGWFGVAPIFYGMQPREARRRVKEGLHELGKRDGALAASIAATNLIPRNTTIFIDREGGDAIAEWIDYYIGWMAGLADNGYWPGMYGSHLLVDNIVSVVSRRTGRRPEVWSVNTNGQKNLPPITNPRKFPAPPPRNSGASTATSWQYTNAFNLTWSAGKVGIDMDSSVYSDPGRRISPLDRI